MLHVPCEKIPQIIFIFIKLLILMLSILTFQLIILRSNVYMYIVQVMSNAKIIFKLPGNFQNCADYYVVCHSSKAWLKSSFLLQESCIHISSAYQFSKDYDDAFLERRSVQEMSKTVSLLS